MLDEEVDSFKTLTALLLSSMKSFVTFRKQGQKGADEAQENRNYYVQAMVDSIEEMIRVLQLLEEHEDLIGQFCDLHLSHYNMYCTQTLVATS